MPNVSEKLASQLGTLRSATVMPYLPDRMEVGEMAHVAGYYAGLQWLTGGVGGGSSLHVIVYAPWLAPLRAAARYYRGADADALAVTGGDLASAGTGSAAWVGATLWASVWSSSGHGALSGAAAAVGSGLWISQGSATVHGVSGATAASVLAAAGLAGVAWVSDAPATDSALFYPIWRSGTRRR